MKITEVTFKRNYNISPLTMEHMHLSATVEVEESDSPEDALLLAQKTVEDFYAKAVDESKASEYLGNQPAPDFELPAIDYKEQDRKEEKLSAITLTIQDCTNKNQAIKIYEANKDFFNEMQATTFFKNLINRKF